MKNNQHTPGPWKAEIFHSKNGEQYSVFSDLGEEIDMICEVETDYKDGGEANARLIAAAPELLEALEKIQKILSTRHFVTLDDGDEDNDDDIIDADNLAQSVIAKAKGENIS